MALVVPIDCNFIGLRNAGSVTVKILSDLTDTEAWDEIAPGVQNMVGGMKIVSYYNLPFSSLHGDELRFPRGAILCYLQAEGQGADIRAQFVA